MATDKTEASSTESQRAVGSPVDRGVGRPVPERASECGLTECAGKPMCVRCTRIADMDALCSLLPEGVTWGDPLTPELLRELLAAETMRWEQALRQTWKMVDPLKPAGQPGSYWRGQDAGIVAALTTLRANLKTPKPEVTGARDQ